MTAGTLATLYNCYDYEGGDPTNLRLQQSGINMVQVSWDPPPGPPSAGYRIVDAGNGVDIVAQSPPQTLALQPGEYNIQVMYTSQHFPGGVVGPETITVRGEEVVDGEIFYVMCAVCRCSGARYISITNHFYICHYILDSGNV